MDNDEVVKAVFENIKVILTDNSVRIVFSTHASEKPAIDVKHGEGELWRVTRYRGGQAVELEFGIAYCLLEANSQMADVVDLEKVVRQKMDDIEEGRKSPDELAVEDLERVIVSSDPKDRIRAAIDFAKRRFLFVHSNAQLVQQTTLDAIALSEWKSEENGGVINELIHAIVLALLCQDKRSLIEKLYRLLEKRHEGNAEFLRRVLLRKRPVEDTWDALVEVLEETVAEAPEWIGRKMEGDEPVNLPKWLLSLLANRLRKRFRRNSWKIWEKTVPTNGWILDQSTAAAAANFAYDLELRDELEVLPDEEHAVIWSFLHGHSKDAIADSLCMSKRTVERRKASGLAFMKERLSKWR